MLEYIFALIGMIVAVALLAAIWYGRQWAQARIGAEGWQEIESYTGKLVEAAEQLYQSGKLQKDLRYRYVLEQLKERFPGLDDQDIQAFVESAVFWLKRGSLLIEAQEIDGDDHFGGRLAG